MFALAKGNKYLSSHGPDWFAPILYAVPSPEYAREIEARRTGIYTLSDDERLAVARGLAEADRGEFAPDTAC
jgi:hypothetical protein